MKACVLEDVGNLVYRNVDAPILKDGEVLLKIRACGICSSDISRIFKTGTYHFPTIPGHEFSGEIVDCSSTADKSLIGKRAAVFPLIPCGKCDLCKKEEYALCENYNYFGSRCDGAFAEYVAVPTWNLVMLPNHISYTTAALCEPVAVALHCARAGRIYQGTTVAVVGTGTIGLSAAMWAKELGAEKIIIVGRNNEKLQFASALGFKYTVNCSKSTDITDFREMTDNKGTDVVLECVGSGQTINLAISLVKKGGRVVLTGNPIGDIMLEKDIYWKILRSELTVTGTWNSAYKSTINDWQDVVAVLKSGRLNFSSLITHKFRLEQYDEALNTIIDPNVFSMKVMFTI